MKIALNDTDYIDLENKFIFCASKTIDLSASEAKFLEKIYSNKSAVVDFEALRIFIWGNAGRHKADQAVKDVWSKLTIKAPILREHIVNVKGIGYKGALASPHDPIFDVIKCVMHTPLPVYSSGLISGDSNCPFTRATLISVVKQLSNIDLDVELSAGDSVNDLNDLLAHTKNDFLLEFKRRDYRFAEINDMVVLKCRSSNNFQADENRLFETLKILKDAYVSYDIHNAFASPKKKELNRTISLFVNAIAAQGLFVKLERKNFYFDLVNTLITTHCHDANFMYPMMADKEKRPPLVRVDLEQVVTFVGEYIEDVYFTDLNALPFISNFLKTLNFHGCDEAGKVTILTNLIYKKHLYDLRACRALVRIDKTKITELRHYIEARVFSLVDRRSLTEDDRRELIAFISMFARGTFEPLIYVAVSNADTYLKRFSVLLHFVLTRFEQIVPGDHIRKKDVAQGLSNVLLTMVKYDHERAKEVFRDIDISKPCFEGCTLLKNVHAFLIDNANLSSLLSFNMLFTNADEFLHYAEDKLYCTENPFLAGNASPLLAMALNKIRAAAKDEAVTVNPRMRDFADNLLLWSLEAAEADMQANKPITFLFLDHDYCLNRDRTAEYRNRKKQLLLSVLRHKRFDQIGSGVVVKIWDYFNYDLKQGELVSELNESIKCCCAGEQTANTMDFLVSNFKYAYDEYNKRVCADNENNQLIFEAVKSTIDHEAHLSFSYKIIKKMAKLLTLGGQQAHVIKLLLSIPHLTALSIYEQGRLFGRLVPKTLSEEISASLVSGENTYRELICHFLSSKIRSWEQAYLKNTLVDLLKIDAFLALDAELQAQLIHFVKVKREYFGCLRQLMDDLARREVFLQLDTKVQTALTIHCHNYLDLGDAKNIVYVGFLDSVLNILAENAYSHYDIKKAYGLRTDTLMYHILETYKAYPERSAAFCISSLCKLYKQLLRLSLEDAFTPNRLLEDRVKIFPVVVANPCIRNIATHYVKRMFLLINKRWQQKPTLLQELYGYLIKILQDDEWPNWFDADLFDALVVKEDSIQTNVKIDVKSCSIDVKGNVDASSNEKTQNQLSTWRDKMDFGAALSPSEENEVVVLDNGTSYLPLSGWGLVYACLGKDDIMPSKIKATVVSVGKITHPHFPRKWNENLTYEKMIDLFEELFQSLLAVVPPKAKKQTKYRVYIMEDAYQSVPKDILQKLIPFVDFYYDYIFGASKDPNQAKIRNNALDAYYDYYNSVKRDVLDKLTKNQEEDHT